VLKHPAVPYVGPFALFVFLVLALMPDSGNYGTLFGISGWEHPFRCLILAVGIWYFSRGVLEFKPRHAVMSIALGIAVFLIWVGPDALWPGYRAHWLFSNSLLGKPASSLPEGFNRSPMVLIFRTLRAVALVPILEELFWRGWLLRWLEDNDFLKVPVGSFHLSSFLIASALFASQHGPYWDVGLACGLIYNWWITRTKCLADSILVHAVTNAALSAYVIFGEHWEFWL
jgi:uncharacterized protein